MQREKKNWTQHLEITLIHFKSFNFEDGLGWALAMVRVMVRVLGVGLGKASAYR